MTPQTLDEQRDEGRAAAERLGLGTLAALFATGLFLWLLYRPWKLVAAVLTLSLGTVGFVRGLAASERELRQACAIDEDVRRRLGAMGLTYELGLWLMVLGVSLPWLQDPLGAWIMRPLFALAGVLAWAATRTELQSLGFDPVALALRQGRWDPLEEVPAPSPAELGDAVHKELRVQELRSEERPRAGPGPAVTGEDDERLDSFDEPGGLA